MLTLHSIRGEETQESVEGGSLESEKWHHPVILPLLERDSPLCLANIHEFLPLSGRGLDWQGSLTWQGSLHSLMQGEGRAVSKWSQHSEHRAGVEGAVYVRWPGQVWGFIDLAAQQSPSGTQDFSPNSFTGSWFTKKKKIVSFKCIVHWVIFKDVFSYFER